MSFHRNYFVVHLVQLYLTFFFVFCFFGFWFFLNLNFDFCRYLKPTYTTMKRFICFTWSINEQSTIQSIRLVNDLWIYMKISYPNNGITVMTCDVTFFLLNITVMNLFYLKPIKKVKYSLIVSIFFVQVSSFTLSLSPSFRFF